MRRSPPFQEVIHFIMPNTSEERIQTLHPRGKKGVNILKRRYDLIKAFILKTLADYGEITYKAVNDLAVEQLQEHFDGSVPWHVVTVKLDLEARGIIERVPQTSPHKIRLKE